MMLFNSVTVSGHGSILAFIPARSGPLECFACHRSQIRSASELGHTTSQLVYQHYREVVTPEEAEQYWKIKPAAEPENVVSFNAKQ